MEINNESSGSNVSIIIPTYNESQNILGILKAVAENIPKHIKTEAIVVDDDSPDGTGKIVEEYIDDFKERANYTIQLIRRKAKSGLSSAILNGIQKANGDTIVVMDSDFSHPPQIIPKLIETLKRYRCDIVVASRYSRGGSIQNWSLKRKLMSKVATKIAKFGLGVESADPMSGFFAFKKNILNGLSFDAIGYKLLLEMLVKTKGAVVREIPYTFTDRSKGESKLDSGTIIDYIRAVIKLYRYGKQTPLPEKSSSAGFISKAARFFTVGASGLGVNYLTSLLFTGFTDLWYLQANLIGILFSMTSNFVLNKIWTFEDRDFSSKKTLIQYSTFVGFSSIGAAVQLGLVYYLMEEQTMSYPIALVVAVMSAALGNYILNKKWTFREKLFS